MKAPNTYSEWVKIIDALKSGGDDAEVLSAMQKGTIEWQSGVAERFVKRLIGSVNDRLNTATDKLQNNMKRVGGNEGAFINSLLLFRKEMAFLAQVVNIPALPSADRQHYVDLVTDHANRVQRSLEDSAKADRSGKLSSIVRNHKVNQI